MKMIVQSALRKQAPTVILDNHFRMAELLQKNIAIYGIIVYNITSVTF